MTAHAAWEEHAAAHCGALRICGASPGRVGWADLLWRMREIIVGEVGPKLLNSRAWNEHYTYQAARRGYPSRTSARISVGCFAPFHILLIVRMHAFMISHGQQAASTRRNAIIPSVSSSAHSCRLADHPQVVLLDGAHAELHPAAPHHITCIHIGIRLDPHPLNPTTSTDFLSRQCAHECSAERWSSSTTKSLCQLYLGKS